MNIRHIKTAFFFITLCFISSMAQTTYKPILSNGKIWEAATINRYHNEPNEPNDTTGRFRVTVIGDTIVNDINCKKIEIVMIGSRLELATAIAREENGKVWRINEDGSQTLLLDMSLTIGDQVDAGYVIAEDVICVNGTQRKRLLIDSGVDSSGEDYLYYIVEGIGINKDKWIIDGGLGIANDNEYCSMTSCIEDGKVIFTSSDFGIPYSSISTVKTDSSNEAIYDLFGRKVTTPSKGSIYIKANKKIIQTF